MRIKRYTVILSRLLVSFTVCALPACTMRSCSSVGPEPIIAVYCNAQSSIPLEECYALGALYTSTNGSNWSQNTGWFENEDPCRWFGIWCNFDHVTSIELSDNNLVGTLPAELGDLEGLEGLNLSGNSLVGPIPFVELGRSYRLEGVLLDHNDLSGTLCGVGELGEVWKLDLSSNQLVGAIPGEMDRMEYLRELRLGDNQLSGEIPAQLGELENLDILDLYGNRLTGSIPAELGNLPLDELRLGQNRLTGQIPVELGNLRLLDTLDLGGNDLTGNIPSELGNLTHLTFLWLAGNRLEGRIPEELGNLIRLEQLGLSFNQQLRGALPLSLMNLSELTLFNIDAYSSRFCRPDDPAFQQWLNGILPGSPNIPICGFDCGLQDSIPTAECDALQTLYESTNGAGWKTNTGWLDSNDPCDWDGVHCDQEHVTTLNLTDNNLVGTIPAELADLTNLGWLRLASNQLSGPLPPRLQSLDALVYLEYDNTDVCEPNTESFQTWLGQPTLFHVGTGVACGFDCALQEHIPETQCDALQTLYESTNGAGWKTNDGWPDSSDPCDWHGVDCDGENVTSLELRSNDLMGTIPPELGHLTRLETLDLANNELSGSIPGELAHLTSLDMLFLHENDLSGGIPPELGSLCTVTRLQLNSNPLTGSIPEELGCLHNLLILMLDDDQLNGSIPGEFARLTNLESLRLGVNDLSGTIPGEFGDLTNLEDLRLQDNQLTGSIPQELSNLTRLQHLYLQQNELEGRIPDTLGDLTKLKQLHLDNNLLSGALPVSLTSLAELETLTYHDTNLCTPTDSAMQAWLNGLAVNGTDVTCNTHVGSGIVVRPPDESNPGERPIKITFNKVTQEGATSLMTMSSEPSPPSGFRMGSPPTYYVVETTASVAQGFSICIDYGGVDYEQLEDLIILQFSYSAEGTWQALSGEPNLSGGESCAEAEQFEPFE